VACRHDRSDTARWPFAVPDETRVFASVRVLLDKLPVMVVCHDGDGDWQFSCGTTGEPEHVAIACLGCLVDDDATLGELADLPPGTLAWRIDPRAPWERGATEPDAD
jgi:hypothetical protein